MRRKSDGGSARQFRGARHWAAAAAVGLALAVVPVAADEAPTELLLYGDSLLAGYGLDESDGFAAQLRSALAAQGIGVEVINASVSGDTSANGAARLDWSLAERPDVALVGLGANDMLRGLPVAGLQTNLEIILDRFERDGIPVLLLGMMADRGLGDDYVSSFDALYPRLAADYDNVTLYPFFLEGVALESSLNQTDGLHPNARGVAEIVSRVTPYVVDLVARAD